MASRSAPLATLLLVTAFAACNSEPGLTIESPVEGAMLAAGEPVPVRVTAPGHTQIRIGDQMVSGDGVFETTVPPADGLGFVSAQVPGSELVAVRSWHQGEFIAPGDWYPDSTVIRIGIDGLTGGPDTLGGIIAKLLEGKELAEQLVTVDIDLAEIDIDSAVATGMDVHLEVVGGALKMYVAATDVRISYRADSALFDSTGTARYERLDINADAALSATGIALSNVNITHPPIAINDSVLPSWAMEAVVGFFDEQFMDAIAVITEQAAQRATVRVLEGIRPIPGVDLPKPITQASELTSAGSAGASLEIHHRARIAAVTPTIARADQLMLARPMTTGTGTERGTSLYASRPLFNQLAFAIWDAGNFSGFRFSKAELQELGIGELGFPYSNLDHVVIDLLVPPILEWSDDGPRFEIGGAQIDIAIDLSKDTRAWAATSVPVKLVPGADGVRLVADPDRPVRVSEVMFERLNDLADQDKAISLVEKAAPGVVDYIFGTLPTFTLPTLMIESIDGGPGVQVDLGIEHIEVLPDAWRLDLAMKVR